jgi:hypothetical protein
MFSAPPHAGGRELSHGGESGVDFRGCGPDFAGRAAALPQRSGLSGVSGGMAGQKNPRF